MAKYVKKPETREIIIVDENTTRDDLVEFMPPQYEFGVKIVEMPTNESGTQGVNLIAIHALDTQMGYLSRVLVDYGTKIQIVRGEVTVADPEFDTLYEDVYVSP